MKNPPTLLFAIGTVLLWIAGQILFGNILFHADTQMSEQSISRIVALLATLVTILLLMKHSQLTVSSLFDHSGNRFNSTAVLVFPPVALVVLGSFGWFSDLQLIYILTVPEDQQAWQNLQRTLAPGIGSFLAVVILAPVLEEVLFRGLFLRGFLHHYPPTLAITLSATMFSVLHFNVYQFLLAFVMGLFVGWLYYRTRSLWPVIFAHGLYNLTSYSTANSHSAEWQFNSLATNLLTLAVSIAGVYMLLTIFSMNNKINNK